MSSDLNFASSSAVTKDPISIQLIDDEGNCDESSLANFVESVNLRWCNVSYAVVAIMGPQSSGKSTLLNYLFSTNFDMMDGSIRRQQTTKGIWMAKAADIEPLTIVLDIEGNDGKEKGHGHPFEKQVALFALAVADIVIINMWCNDIGRDAAANKPLFRTVFEAMAQSFSPNKTTLLFVIRDYLEIPISSLEADVNADLVKIWGEVEKKEEYKDAALSDFFIVRFTTLCNYKLQKEEFMKQVGDLRELFQDSITPGGIAGDREGRVPGTGFKLNVETLWKSIKENKNFHLPTHKIMVAKIRCEAIANDKQAQFFADEKWLELKGAAELGPVPNFGSKISEIISHYLSEYDREAMYFDDSVRDEKRLTLKKEILADVKPTHDKILGYHKSQCLANFKTQLEMMLTTEKGFADCVREVKNSCLRDFDNHCQDVAVVQATHWGARNMRANLSDAIDASSSHLRKTRLSKIIAQSEKNLSERLEEAVMKAMGSMLLEGQSGESWPVIRALLVSETDDVTSIFKTEVSGYEMDASTYNGHVERIRKYGISRVEKRAREEGKRVYTHMRTGFMNAYNQDKNSMPRQWTDGDDINSITQEARSVSLKILSDLAILRLEEGIHDNVEQVLFSCLMNDSSSTAKSIKNAISSSFSGDPLAKKTWEKVPPSITIITPIDCKIHWKNLQQDNVTTIHTSQMTQEAKRERDAALKSADIAQKELQEKQEAIAKAESDKMKAVGDAEKAQSEVKLAKLEAALEIAKSKLEVAEARKAEAIAKAQLAESRTKRNEPGCVIS